jgi:hypothetical protein
MHSFPLSLFLLRCHVYSSCWFSRLRRTWTLSFESSKANIIDRLSDVSGSTAWLSVTVVPPCGSLTTACDFLLVNDMEYDVLFGVQWQQWC